MERQAAIQKLSEIISQDLRGLADKYGVTVFKGGNLNKGWAGQVIEKYLGFSNNSLQGSQCWVLGAKADLPRISEKWKTDR